DLAQPILIPFVDGHGDVHRFARSGLQQRNVEPFMAGIVDHGFRICHVGLEVAAILVLGSNPLRVFFQLGGVVGLGEDVFQENRVRDADGPQVLHGGTQDAAADVLISVEADLTYLNLRAFFHNEGNAYRCRRNLPHLGANGGELPAVFGKQILDRDLGSFYACGIVLALHHQSDLILLEAVENVTLRNRTCTYVGDLADGRLLFHLYDEAPAFGRLLAEKLDVFEVTGIPKRVEVSFEGSLIV